MSFFKPEDFKSITIFPEACAQIANAKRDEALEDAKEIIKKLAEYKFHMNCTCLRCEWLKKYAECEK